MGEPPKDTRPTSPTRLTLQEEILGKGALLGKNATTDFVINASGKRLNPNGLYQDEFNILAREFRLSPFVKLASIRENLKAIMADDKIDLATKKDRVKRYVDAALELTIKLDHAAFPPNDQVQRGIPNYVPDGLSDMGSDPSTDPTTRGREKIRIDKKQIFEQAKSLIYGLYSMELDPRIPRQQWKEYVVNRVAYFVYTSMPYNRPLTSHPDSAMRSILLSEIQEEKLAVCRHHALMTQVLLQTFGITSKLMKSNLDIDGPLGAHANNLARIEGQWYLLDTTNPEFSSDQPAKIFLKPVPEKTIDLNTGNYSWTFAEANGKSRTYDSRSNMFWRIRDNRFPSQP